MSGTPITKQTKSTAYTFMTLSIIAELIGMGTSKWVQLGAWLWMLLGCLTLLRGVKKKGY